MSQEDIRPSRKPYDPYMDKSTKWAVTETIRRIKLPGYKLKDISEDKGIDIDIIRDSGKSVGGLEIEVKRKWNSEFWEYPNVHFLERKVHFSSIPFSYYIIVSADGSTIVGISFKELVKHDRFVKDTSDTQNEEFREVPLKHCFQGWNELQMELNRVFLGQLENDWITDRTRNYRFGQINI